MNQNKVIIAFSVVVLSLFIGCKTESYKLTDTEKKICETNSIDPAIIQEIRRHNTHKIESFHYSLGKSFVADSMVESNPIFLRGLVFGNKIQNRMIWFLN